MNKEIVYCSNRHCPYLECLRHDKNIPWNIIILRDDFKIDKNGQCKNILKIGDTVDEGN